MGYASISQPAGRTEVNMALQGQTQRAGTRSEELLYRSSRISVGRYSDQRCLRGIRGSREQSWAIYILGTSIRGSFGRYCPASITPTVMLVSSASLDSRNYTGSVVKANVFTLRRQSGPLYRHLLPVNIVSRSKGCTRRTDNYVVVGFAGE